MVWRRSIDEQVDHASKKQVLKDILIPGVDWYNQAKRLGVSRNVFEHEDIDALADTLLEDEYMVKKDARKYNKEDSDS